MTTTVSRKLNSTPNGFHVLCAQWPWAKCPEVGELSRTRNVYNTRQLTGPQSESISET